MEPILLVLKRYETFIIAKSLSKLFDRSLKDYVFPIKLKIAIAIPLFKKKDDPSVFTTKQCWQSHETHCILAFIQLFYLVMILSFFILPGRSTVY